jgi:hypothetical protein
MIEHNMVAASRVYDNIKFVELGACPLLPVLLYPLKSYSCTEAISTTSPQAPTSTSTHMIGSGCRHDTHTHVLRAGKLLGIEPAQAEKVAARMIGEGRLKGSMDQVDGILQFDVDADPLLSWDDRIEAVCKNVNACLESVTKAYPQLIE